MKKVLAAVLLALVMVSGAYAANTVEHGQGVLRLVLDSDFDWSAATITAGRNKGAKLATLYPEGLALTAFMFKPSAANDVAKLREGALTGQIIFDSVSVDGGTLVRYYPGTYLVKPYIEYDDLTLGTAANARFFLEFSNGK